MAARLKLTTDLLRNGTHLLITDVDNVFSRHVPLHGFLEQGYDVYHAFEMFYPTWIYHIHGFVICSGHQFLRSSPETLNFMDLVMDRCRGKKCDDQNTYNEVFFWDLNITWDNNMGRSPATREGALRVNSTGPESNNLLVESATGRSPVTNHTIKIWDRDFAWRVSFVNTFGVIFVDVRMFLKLVGHRGGWSAHIANLKPKMCIQQSWFTLFSSHI